MVAQVEAAGVAFGCEIDLNKSLNVKRSRLDDHLRNQPRPNRVHPLNPSEASNNSGIVDVVTLAMTIPLPLQEALRDSITSGTFVDTKFWVFSKRGPKSGRIGEPKALFANGHVVRRVPRLGSCEHVYSYLCFFN